MGKEKAGLVALLIIVSSWCVSSSSYSSSSSFRGSLSHLKFCSKEFVYLSHYGKNSKQVTTSCVASSMEELQDWTIKVKVLNKLSSARASGAGSGSRVLTDLVEGLEEAAVAVELRLKINQSHPDLKIFPRLWRGSVEALGVNYEGVVRVSGFGGWFLLRLSLHDPVLPLNIEAPTHDDAVKLGLAVLGAVKEFAALDTSALDKFVQVS
ncbi:uncharacterized protein LOC104428235 [Eucalyptus grandis]|uniref:uncharacterized protein LOC104428235 n=1 Tax=Eucalyptus grandis TaxID=71139 RepID=UPI00192F0480|nr:uncharacterized protein LOC104428235 [Eucalyptus grandis]